MITVLRHPKIASPESDNFEGAIEGDVQGVPLSEALTREWPSDAHATQYAPAVIDGCHVRLASGALDEGVPVTMVALMGDLDDPIAHASGEAARDEWRAEVLPRIEASGLAHYATRGGFRVVAELDAPLVLRERADAELWKYAYAGWCEYLRATHGLELDGACTDWTRLFRLPNVEREGRGTQRAELCGELTRVDPTPGGQWLEPPARAAKASTALAPLTELPPANAGIAAALGPSEAHAGRKWLLLGHVGGMMRQAGFTREECEAEVREWLPTNDPAVNVDLGVARAVGAWSADHCTGYTQLAEVIGEQHANIVQEACIAKRHPWASAERREARIRAAHRPASIERAEPSVLCFDETRQGVPHPTHVNIARACEAWLGDRVRLEAHSNRITIAGIDDSLGYFPDGEWTDRHTTAFVILCEQHGLRVQTTAVRKVIDVHAHERSYNVLTDFLLECAAAWDGCARVDGALTQYWKVADSPATVATSRVFLLSLAARGLTPGEKVDTCPVFVGAQGVRKSSSLAALVGAPWFSDSPLPIGDKDAMQNLAGTWLWEFSEGESLSRRERNAVKAFLSSSTDKFRASYGYYPERFARQTCFVASTNDAETLTDPTGNRRFLPVTIGGRVDVEAIERDRVQLLGEAAYRVIQGEQHWPSDEEDVHLNVVRAEHEETDEWEHIVGAWLTQRGGEPFTVGDVCDLASGAVPIPPDRLDKRVQMRMGTVLRRLGYERGARRLGGQLVRVWIPRALPRSQGASTAAREAVNAIRAARKQ